MVDGVNDSKFSIESSNQRTQSIAQCVIYKVDNNKNTELIRETDLEERIAEINTPNKAIIPQKILPENIWNKAHKRLNELNYEDSQTFSNLTKEFEKNHSALYTLYSILAYDTDFSSKSLFNELTSNENREKFKESLQEDEKSSKSQYNFQQNYLNTCQGVSTFSVLADAFCYNTFVLAKLIGLQLNELKKPENDQEKPAYSSYSWLKAPTVTEEYNRRMQQCQDGIAQVLDPEKNLSEEASFKILTQTFERMSAITEGRPILLSKRIFQSFPISCITSIILTFLAKIFSLGFYRSSLSLEERLAGVSAKPSGIIHDNTNQNTTTWENIYKYGMTLELKDLGICGHVVAVKAIEDKNGKKYLEIHDPLKEKIERIEVKDENTPIKI